MFNKSEKNWQSERDIMVSNQLIRRGIRDKMVLDAFRKVPRHEFVPEKLRYSAYEDFPLPVGFGQTISQPYMVASMTELCRLEGNEKVLEIGSGSGYQAAVLAELCTEVYSVERIKELADFAISNINRLEYKNIFIMIGDGTRGWSEYAPFDAIIVTAGSPGIPQALVEQLKIGGRLVIPVGNEYSQILTVLTKREKKDSVEELYGCMFVPLIGEEGWKG